MLFYAPRLPYPHNDNALTMGLTFGFSFLEVASRVMLMLSAADERLRRPFMVWPWL